MCARAYMCAYMYARARMCNLQIYRCIYTYIYLLQLVSIDVGMDYKIPAADCKVQAAYSHFVGMPNTVVD